MKLMRLGPQGHERAYVSVEGGEVVDVSDLVPDVDAAFLASVDWESLAGEVAARMAAGATEPIGARRVGSPIARPHQILCIGLNYHDHALEAGMTVPDEPVVFTKSPNSLAGPYDDLVLPAGSTSVDWEVELGIVIGQRSFQLPDLAAARAAIAGYVVVNDVSERVWQLERAGQWSKGKSAPGFCPVGPYLVTEQSVTDVLALGMWLDVDGEPMQKGSTATMLFDPVTVVHYVSQFLALEPGDLICTGTPPGVGMGMAPPRYLRPGEEIRLGVDGLGEQRQLVVAAAADSVPVALPVRRDLS